MSSLISHVTAWQIPDERSKGKTMKFVPLRRLQTTDLPGDFAYEIERTKDVRKEYRRRVDIGVSAASFMCRLALALATSRFNPCIILGA